MTQRSAEGDRGAAHGGGISRRALLRDIGLAGGAGIGLGIGLSRLELGGASSSSSSPASAPDADGSEAVDFYGQHQAGVETAPPAHVVLAAFDVSTTSVADLSGLMREWTLAARRMTAGEAADAQDSGEALGLGPAALTVTFGFGSSLFDGRFGLSGKKPAGLTDLPVFPGDRLDVAMSHGDLVIQSCSSDQQVASHAVRQLSRIGSGVVSPRWAQTGFRPDAGDGSSPRNLLGFKDGTINPAPGTAAFASTVWVSPPGWMGGGTYLCVRRIRINLGAWDAQTVADQQVVIGRAKLSGAPLSGGGEDTPLDLQARAPDGTPAIPIGSHVRLAAPQSNGGAAILRRGYSFDDGIDPRTGEPDSGTLFLAFMADIGRQFVPIQSRLATNDRLNSFVTPVASATFAVPPGTSARGYVGETLLG